MIGRLQLYSSLPNHNDLEVVLSELLGPTNLPRAEPLSIYKSMQVNVVSKNENLIFIAFSVVTPCFKSFNNSQKLMIVSFVTSFAKNHFLKEKS